MRITADAKLATRRRITDSARKLFSGNGFQNTTTRDIARAAGIASGTLFNYFATKEAIAMSLVAHALTQAQDEFGQRPRADGSLEEHLFSHIALELRHLKPFRNLIQPVLETAMSPVAGASAGDEGDAMRVGHLETVERLIVAHGGITEPAPFTMQLYWTLYTGVLAFWAVDESPNQEDTLALLDQSLKMFVASLQSERTSEEACSEDRGR